MNLQKWIKNRRDILRNLENIEPKDRLEAWNLLRRMNEYVGQSVVGWAMWLCSIKIQEKFTLDEILEIIERYKKIMKEMGELDVHACELYLKKSNVAPKKEIKRDMMVV